MLMEMGLVREFIFFEVSMFHGISQIIMCESSIRSRKPQWVASSVQIWAREKTLSNPCVGFNIGFTGKIGGGLFFKSVDELSQPACFVGIVDLNFVYGRAFDAVDVVWRVLLFESHWRCGSSFEHFY